MVRKSSWHYRLLDGYSPIHIASNVCTYFWQVVIWTASVIILVPSTIVAVVLPPVLLYLGDPALEQLAELSNIVELWIMICSVIGIVAWFLAAGALTLFILGTIVRLIVGLFPDRDPFDERRVPTKEPGLFRQWMKAKKEKMCPLIEFTDD